MSRQLHALLAALAVAAAALTLAACGGGSPSSSGTGDGDEEQRLAFQDCMRKAGIDVSIAPDGRGVAIGARREGRGRSLSNAGDAMRRCRESTGWAPPEPSEAEKEEFRDRALRFARCMRAHGADVADPAPDGRMTMTMRGDSPTFRAAQKACGARMGIAGAAPATPAP